MGKTYQLFVELLISAMAVVITAYLLPGVHVNNFLGALVVAGVLSLLNTFVKPMLVLLTIPFTVLTFGLFLVVINATIILLASSIVPGFEVGGFGWAILFSIILSVINSLFRGLVNQYKQQ